MNLELLNRFYIELTDPDEMGLSDSRFEEVFDLARKALSSGPNWIYRSAEQPLPEGTPVLPGTRLYAFKSRSEGIMTNGYWTYELPQLP